MKQFFNCYILIFCLFLFTLWSAGCDAQATITYINLGTSSGNFVFTAPSCGGISFTAQCWAGGGGGGGSGTGGIAGVTPGGGGGGSGGGFAQGTVTLTSTGTYYYSVGGGGTAGSNAAGGAGGATWFNGTVGTNNNTSGNYINATGGSGGAKGSGGSAGGQSTVGSATFGAGTTSHVSYTGGTGASGNNNDVSGDGGGGGGGAGSGQNGSNGSGNGTTGGGGGNGGNNAGGTGHGTCTGTCLGDYSGGAGSAGGGGAGGGGSIPAPSSYSGGNGGFPGGAGGGSHSFSFGSSQPGGTGGAGQISITYVMPAPVISGFSPTSYCGTPGSTLTITGCGFMTPIAATNLVTSVTINGTSISGYTVASASSITIPASSLAGLTSGVIAVTTMTGVTPIGTATTNGTGGSVNQTLSFFANPTVNAGTALSVCARATTAALGGSFGGGATAAVWTDGLSGGSAGTFTNNGGSTPGTATYTASLTAPSSITLTLTTSGGSCGTTSATKTLTVNPNPTVSAGSALSAMCQGATTAALGGSYGGGATSAVWSDGLSGASAGTFTSNSGTTPNTTIYTASASAPSSVTLTLTTSGGSCGSISTSKTVTINPNPTVNAGSALSAMCQGATTVALGGSYGGGATSALWSDGLSGASAGTFTNNSGTTPGTATYTASASAPSSVTLTLTTSGGSCGSLSASKTVTINPNPTVSAGSALSPMCQGATTAALGGSYGGGATSAVWSDGLSGASAGTFTNNSGTMPNTATYTASASAPSSVTLTLTTSGGSCGSIFASKTVTINPNPIVTTHTPAAVCSPATIDLTAPAVTAGSTAGLSYTYWNDAGATSSYATPSAATSGTYYIKGSTGAGCYDIQPVTVTIKPSPAATASNTGPYLTAQTISLSSGPSGQTSYAWSGPSGYSASGQNQTRPTATLSMAGMYTVTVTASNGCSDTAMTYVVVNIPGGYTWTGATSTDWTTLSNWSPTPLAGGPAGCTESVIIPVVGRYPILTSAVTIGSVTINDNAQMTLNAALSVCGNVTGGTSSAGNILGTSNLIMTGSTSAQSMSGIITLNSLTINESPGVYKTGTLMINKVLTITSGNFNNSSGTVTLASNASGDAYLDNFTSPTAGAYIGNMTVQKYISNTADGYRDLSSPVSTTVADLNAAYAVTGQNGVQCYYSYTPYPNVQIYDEPLSLVNGSYDEHWVSYTALTNNLGPTRGVAFRTYVGTPFTISFSGPPYSGSLTTNITHTTTATPGNDGFNLIGNPYPSPVRWSLIKGMNGGGLGGSYYVNHTSGAYTGTWGSYNGVTGVNGAGDVISIGQGFFVQTSVSGSLTMNNSVRTGTPGLYYGRLSALDNEVRLSLSRGTNSDEIVTYTDPQASGGFDPQLDAIKMPAAASVYISYNMAGYYYAINVIDTINDHTELPLALYARDTGTCTLTAPTLNVPGMTAYLRDNQNNLLTDLSAGPIPIMLAGGQTDYRYSVIFKRQAGPSGIVNTEKSSTRIYSSGDKVYVLRPDATAASISVANVIGQSIKEQNTNTEMTILEIPAVEPLYAIVKVTEGQKVTVAKVLISNK